MFHSTAYTTFKRSIELCRLLENRAFLLQLLYEPNDDLERTRREQDLMSKPQSESTLKKQLKLEDQRFNLPLPSFARLDQVSQILTVVLVLLLLVIKLCALLR